jgi:hypothetical protein
LRRYHDYTQPRAQAASEEVQHEKVPEERSPRGYAALRHKQRIVSRIVATLM